ncbi:hypothetical protein PVK06_031239 [Gossypium arboreum]|uniref:Uncharacterized protein n=1 Tax=Gossypium arboreum TaxID=29729 RepID=A0ABR0NRH5_GOSAR|nr:hypothetical protein PVK06_031239 [Gossypium arboreum]
MLFDQLTKSIERSQIRLNSSPYWIKIGPCLPEIDKEDLMHAIGVTFGGVLRSTINCDFYRLRVQLNVQKPLRKGIFISTENQSLLKPAKKSSWKRVEATRETDMANGSPRAVKRLRYLLKQHKPQMVFLMETKIDVKRMEKIRRRCGFENGIGVGTAGYRDGISMAWKAGITVCLNNFSKSHIDVIVKGDNVNEE